jgi:hypothetical protein
MSRPENNNYDEDIIDLMDDFKAKNTASGIDFETWSTKIHKWCYIEPEIKLSQEEYDTLSDEVFMSYYGTLVTCGGSIREPLKRFEENISKSMLEWPPRNSDERRVVENKKRLLAVFNTIGRYFGH